MQRFLSSGDIMSIANIPSKVLDETENEIIFSKLQKNVTTMCTCVVQLYLTQPPKHNSWVLFNSGIICLSRDAIRKSYFIQLYSLFDTYFVWEQEIYADFTIKMSSSHFLSFEAESCLAGLNFYSDEEANDFFKALMFKLEERNKKRQERLKHKNKQQPKNSAASKNIKKKFCESFGISKSHKKGVNDLVIGSPQDFRHVTHIGYDPQKGFDLANCEPAWSKLFNSLGVNQSLLSDQNTSNFIYDFVQNNGGIETMVQEIDTFEKAQKAVPTVERSSNKLATETAIRSSKPPPPPPARRSTGSALEVQSLLSVPQAIEVDVLVESQAPQKYRNSASVDKGILESSKLLDTSSTGRDDLLSQINQGIKLKKSNEMNLSLLEKGKNLSEDEMEENSMVGILAKRLANMRVNVAEDESESELEDDWE